MTTFEETLAGKIVWLQTLPFIHDALEVSKYLIESGVVADPADALAPFTERVKAEALMAFSDRLLASVADLESTHSAAFTNGIRWAAIDAIDAADAIEKGTER